MVMTFGADFYAPVSDGRVYAAEKIERRQIEEFKDQQVWNMRIMQCA